MHSLPSSPLSEREIVITGETHLPREKLYFGLTSAELYPQWFFPDPKQLSDVTLDVRSGGGYSMTMNRPDGQSIQIRGVYLEVIPNERLVWTDGFFAGWEPNPNLMIVGTRTLESLPNGGTRYTATARHWTKEACETSAAMGIRQFWQDAFERLVKVCEKL
jgi:uncharacterized protein YndB with AHSA1/START domain